ncbi:MAG TPA: MBL fold metallo-hydrolase [Pilimelia sp.]|nr:MBL fold metallo-hydrolase [Pilimelia sp.]
MAHSAHTPAHAAPAAAPGGLAAGTVTFVGTATTLLRLGDFTLLTDPNFLHAGQRAYLGHGLWSRRRTEPALGVGQLPRLDGIVLSHLHGDHFDRVARALLPPTVPVVTTAHASRRLRRWGFAAATALHTWETFTLRRGDQALHVTSVPAQHGPRVLHRLMPPTMGSIVDLEVGEARRLRLYLTGDTLYRPELAEVARRYGDIDAMLIHLGGTRIMGVLLTMDAAQGVTLMETVPARVTLPIHYDDYPVFRSPLSDFLDHAQRRGLRERVTVLRRGDTVPLAAPPGPARRA